MPCGNCLLATVTGTVFEEAPNQNAMTKRELLYEASGEAGRLAGSLMKFQLQSLCFFFHRGAALSLSNV